MHKNNIIQYVLHLSKSCILNAFSGLLLRFWGLLSILSRSSDKKDINLVHLGLILNILSNLSKIKNCPRTLWTIEVAICSYCIMFIFKVISDRYVLYDTITKSWIFWYIWACNLQQIKYLTHKYLTQLNHITSHHITLTWVYKP